MIKKIIPILIIFFIISPFVSAVEYTNHKPVKHFHNESSYQHAWCSAHNGIEEVENADKTRVDCLTKYHAVEFDFANKWAESIGQALHYQKMTGKKGMVVLILENPEEEMCYFKKVKALGDIYNFDTEYITPKILNIQNGKCPYPDCKCHRKITQHSGNNTN